MYAVITGSTGGLGRAFVRMAAQEGYRLALVALEPDLLAKQLDELAAEGHQAVGLAADFREPAGRAATTAWLQALDGPVEVVVANAGFGRAGSVHELDAATVAGMVAVDAAAPTWLARALLPGMVARGRGHLLFVASYTAFFPVPAMAVYAASKAYLRSLGEALNAELAGTGVTVTAFCPGLLHTGFEGSAGLDTRRLWRHRDSLFRSATPAARAGWSAMKAGRSVCLPGRIARLSVAASRLLPRRAWLRLMTALMAADRRPDGEAQEEARALLSMKKGL